MKTRRWGFYFSFHTELIPRALPFLDVEITLGSGTRESPAGTSQLVQKCNNLGQTTAMLWCWLLLLSPALAVWELRLSCINHHPELVIHAREAKEKLCFWNSLEKKILAMLVKCWEQGLGLRLLFCAGSFVCRFQTIPLPLSSYFEGFSLKDFLKWNV